MIRSPAALWRHAVAPACAALFIVSCHPTASPSAPLPTRSTNGAQTMSSNSPAAGNDNFGLSDSDFWGDATRTRDATIEKLWQQRRDVLAIAAPRLVPVDQRSTLPVVVYRAGSYRDLWALSFDQNAFAVAVALEENRAYLTRVQTEELEEPAAPPDLSKAPKGSSSDVAVLELRAATNMPWHASTYIVTVLMRDHVSNRARVELGKSPATYHDEEVAKFLAAQKGELPPPVVRPRPGEPLPSYAARPDSPAVPETRGVALAVDRVVLKQEGARSILRGSFRLPAQPHELVRPLPPPREHEPPRPAPPTAVVGITLVVTGGDEPIATAMRLDVPSWDPVDKTTVVTGHFAIDLLDTNLLSDHPQTYFLYAFSGEAMTGPVPTAIVTREMLPAR